MRKQLFKTTAITLAMITAALGMTACGNKTAKTTETVQETQAVAVQTEKTTENAKEIKTDTLTVTGLTTGEADDIKVSDVATEDEAYINVSEKLPDTDIAHVTTMYVYNIDLLKDNAKIQPSGKVKIALKLADDLLNAAGDRYEVFRTEADNTLTKLASEVKDNIITFETDHFSVYTVVKTDSTYVSEEEATEAEEVAEEAEATEEPQTEAVVADNSGSENVVAEVKAEEPKAVEVAVNEPDTTPAPTPVETPVVEDTTPVVEEQTEAPAQQEFNNTSNDNNSSSDTNYISCEPYFAPGIDATESLKLTWNQLMATKNKYIYYRELSENGVLYGYDYFIFNESIDTAVIWSDSSSSDSNRVADYMVKSYKKYCPYLEY